MKDVPLGKFADDEPAIIRFLRIICDGDGGNPTQRQWAMDALGRALANWKRDENLDQLKRDLGLVGQKKRRRVSTVRNESMIAMACRDAALNGSERPFDEMATNFGWNIERVERAWKEWGPMYIAILEATSETQPQFAKEIATAIGRLKKQNKN